MIPRRHKYVKREVFILNAKITQNNANSIKEFMVLYLMQWFLTFFDSRHPCQLALY